MTLSHFLFVMVLQIASSNLAAESRSPVSVEIAEYKANKGKKEKNLNLDLRKLKIEVLKVYDPQYEKTLVYRGLSLLTLITEASELRGTNSGLLLDFKNGMRIHLPLSEVENNKNDYFLALEFKEGKKKWSDKFPEKISRNFMTVTPLPIRFEGSKFVKKSNSKESKTFSPWVFVDSLVRIQFVDLDSYLNQFNLKEAHEGYSIYEKRCIFCHGVRSEGAKLGWDFVEPIPIYKKRDPQSLFYHVSVPKAKNYRYATRMPVQEGFSKDEAGQLWNWLKLVAEKPLKKYKN